MVQGGYFWRIIMLQVQLSPDASNLCRRLASHAEKEWFAPDCPLVETNSSGKWSHAKLWWTYIGLDPWECANIDWPVLPFISSHSVQVTGNPLRQPSRSARQCRVERLFSVSQSIGWLTRSTWLWPKMGKEPQLWCKADLTWQQLHSLCARARQCITIHEAYWLIYISNGSLGMRGSNCGHIVGVWMSVKRNLTQSV